VTAIDTEPLAADPAVVIAAYGDDFADGLRLVSRLFDVDTVVCCRAGASIPSPSGKRIRLVNITGPHPAGLVGTHIHHIDPVGIGKTVWHLNYQDVIAIGRLFNGGRLWTTRIVALAGPPVLRPRLIPVVSGCDIAELVADEIGPGSVRLISGSVLSGRQIITQDRFLGRYHTQISVIDEAGTSAATKRAGAAGRVSMHGVFTRLLSRGKKFRFDTAMNGRTRALIPLELFERVMPFDILATPLLKSLLVGDAETASALGCLELVEEDLALCEFVCASKHNYGLALRRCLNQLEAENS
jgi:Na+-transporting NADH:ubiquinone oxidoreductase subunit A